MAAGLFSILFMIKLRCNIAEYPCGFMSFAGGITWHLLAGFVTFTGAWVITGMILNKWLSLGWRVWVDTLGRSMTPLLGLGIAVLWEVLPVQVIHPPSHGGPCPSIPIICHDTPLWGFGGLAFWSLPFLAWTAVLLLHDIYLGLQQSTHEKAQDRTTMTAV
jgi:hypothetical protein